MQAVSVSAVKMRSVAVVFVAFVVGVATTPSVYDHNGDGPACYSMVGCAQQFELHQGTQESCCLGNGAAVRSNSSSECLKCIVANFTEGSYAMHQEQSQSIQVTVSKGLEFAAAVVVKPKVVYSPAEDDTRDVVQIIPSTLTLQNESTTFTVIVSKQNTFIREFDITLEVVEQPADIVVVLDHSTARITVTDDREVVQFSQGSYTVTENELVVELQVERFGPLDCAVEIRVQTQPGSATASNDYSPMDEAIVLQPDEGFISINVTISDDTVFEHTEEFFVTLRTSDNSLLVQNGNVSIVILDDEVVTIGFEEETYTVQEGSGTARVCACIIAGVLEAPLSFGIHTAGGTARIPFDRTGVRNMMLSPDFDRVCTSIIVIDDNVLEEDETFMVHLSSTDPAVILKPQITTVTIVDNDVVTVSFENVTYAVTEGNASATVCAVTAGATLGRETSLTITTVDVSATNGADYISTSTTIHFRSRTDRNCVEVPLLDDDILEYTETFRVYLMSSDPTVMTTGNPAIIIIEDDDNVTVGFSAPSYTVDEEAGLVNLIVAILSGQLEMTVDVNIHTLPGSARAGDDYVPLLTMLTFDENTTSHVVPVYIISDTVVEWNETLYVEVLSRNDAVILQDTAEVTIVDDDTITIRFEATEYTVREADTAVEVCVIASGSVLERTIVVSVHTSDGSATDGADYVSTSTTIHFRSSMERNCVEVPLLDDDIVEYTETFRVYLMCSDPTVVASESTAVIIIQDDDNVTVGFSAPSYSVEEETGLVNLTVGILSGVLGTAVDVNVHTLPGSARAGDDYVPLLTMLTFDENTTSHVVPVYIISDTVVEWNETLYVEVLSTNDVVILQDTVEVTIVDDDTITIRFEATEYTVREADTAVEVCVITSGSVLERTIVVSVHTSNGSATDGADYISTSTTIHFRSSMEQKCVEVPLLDDDILEHMETFGVYLISSDPTVIASQSTAIIVIQDDDNVTVGFSTPSFTVDEETGLVNLTVVILSGELGTAVDVIIQTLPGSARAGDDYVPLLTTLTFDENTTSHVVPVYIISDTVVEWNETLYVEILSRNDAVILQDTAEVTIVDDDTLTVELEAMEYTVREADTTVEVCVITSGSVLERTIVVSVHTSDGSATDGADYISTSTTIHIWSSMDRNCVELPLLNDDILEYTETFRVYLMSSDPTVVASGNPAIIIIKDDDNVTVGFSAPSYTVEEETGQVNLIVAVLSGVLGTAVDINVRTLPGSARAGDDYVPLLTMLTFDENTTSHVVPVYIISDTVVEWNETLYVEILSRNDAVILQDTVEVTIVDDDTITIGFEATEYTVREADTAVEVCVITSGSVLERSIVVSVRTSDGSATDGADYISTSTTVHFWSSVEHNCVEVPLLDDDILEYTELFSVYLMSSDSTVIVSGSLATIIIQDDDNVTVGFSAPSYTVEEETGQVNLIVAVLSGVLGTAVDINVRTLPGSARAGDDYVPLLTTLTFDENTTSHVVPVYIISDTVVEWNETLYVEILSRNDAVILQDTVEVTIVDDDTITIGFEATEYTVREADTAVEVCVITSGSVLERSIVVSVRTSDGSATDGADYISTSTTVHFRSSVEQNCVEVPLLDDDILEYTEMFSVYLMSSDSTVIVSGSLATIIIQDDDNVTVGFSAPSYTVEEETGLLNITVAVLSGVLGTAVDINVHTLPGTARAGDDYVPLLTTLTFDENTTSHVVPVYIISDTVVEWNETLYVEVLSRNDAVILQDTAEVTIVDDDTITIGLDATEYTVREADTAVEVCAITSGSVLERTIVVSVHTSDGSATDGADYVSTSTTVHFRSSMERNCVEVPLLDDDILEHTETFRVYLMSSDPTIAASESTAVIIIQDDDNVTVGFSAPSYSVEEETGLINLTVGILSGILGTAVDVNVHTLPGSARAGDDYVPLLTMLTFDENTTSHVVPVYIINDNVVEWNETLHVKILSTNDVVILQDTVEVTIVDDDTISVGLEATEYTVREADTAVEVCVITSGSVLERTIVVSVHTSAGSATDGADYISTSTTIHFRSSMERKCVEVPLLDDDILEHMETFGVYLISSDPTVIASQSTAIIIIQDDDNVTVGFSTPSFTVDEETGLVNLTAVILSGVLETAVDVIIQTLPGSARAGNDYVPLLTMLTFDENTTSHVVPVYIISDTVVEWNETLHVKILSTNDVVILQDTAEVTIIDDDTITIGLDATEYTVREADTAEVCVITSGSVLERTIVVSVLTSDGSATDGADYISTSTTIHFRSSMEQKCVEVPLLDDDILEYTETFRVYLMSSDPTVMASENTAIIIIQDDDNVTLSFSAPSFTVEEETGQVNLTVAVYSGQLGMAVDVNVHILPGSARAGDDYVPLLTMLTFDENTTSHVVPVYIISDTVVEWNETLYVEILSRNDAVILQDAVEVTIVDDDTITIGFETTGYTVREADTAVEVCAITSGSVLERTVAVSVHTSDGNATDCADYISTSTTVHFRSTMERNCVEVPLLDDDILEYTETFRVYLMSSDPTVVASGNPAIIIIQDDDNVTIGFSAPSFTVDEETGLVNLTVVILSGVLGTAVDIIIQTLPGSARAGNDYVPLLTTLTFDENTTSHVVPVYIISDTVVEWNETLYVEILSRNDAVILQDAVEVTIVDDDTVTVGLEATEYTVREADTAVEVCAITSGSVLERTIVVSVHTSDGSATDGDDYSSPLAHLSFKENVSRDCSDVSIINDAVVENDETFMIFLQSSEPRTQLQPGSCIINIVDDDVAQIGFLQTFYTVREDERSLVVEVGLLRGRLGKEVEVSVVAIADTASVNDFVLKSQPTFILNSTVSTEGILFHIINDVIDENYEEFILQLTMVTDESGVTLQPTISSVRILDDDSAMVGLEAAVYQGSESSGSVEICVSLFDSLIERNVTVSLVTTGEDATDSEDFETTSFDMLLTSSEPRLCIAIAIFDDNIVELEEHFKMFISSDEDILPHLRSATVYIEDNDVMNVGFESSIISFSEGVGMATVEIIKDGVSSFPFDILISGVPLTIVDVVPSVRPISKAVSFGAGPGSPNSTCINFTVTDDNVGLESIEVLAMSLSLLPPTRSRRDSERELLLHSFILGVADITIEDDDVVSVSLTEENFTVTEDTGSTSACVQKDIETVKEFDVTFEVNLATSTAVGGRDFEQRNATVTLGTQPNSIACQNITIVDDSNFEMREALSLSLRLPMDLASQSNIQLASSHEMHMAIEDNDEGVPMSDTIPGESLMTVPLIVVNQDQLRLPETYLCFQVHGAAFQYFNLISDHCLSVNAHYKAANRHMNVIDSITVRTVDNAGSCVNIEINVPTCYPLIDGTEYHQSYTLHGVAVRLRSHGTRVSVPNCGSGRVVIRMTCQSYWITNPVTGQRNNMDVIKFVVTHGASLQATSHGLLGQFWNVPVYVQKYNGFLRSGRKDAKRYIIEMDPPYSSKRIFTGSLESFMWDFSPRHCFYAGNKQGGPSNVVDNPNGSPIEGQYQNYWVPGPFSTHFAFSRFEDLRCS